MEWRERITVDPAVRHGKPRIKGARIMVSVILDSLAGGVPTEAILKSHPSLAPEDTQAALGFAADLSRDRHAAQPETIE